MKWSKPIREKYTTSYSITARKKGYKAEVAYNSCYDIYYFLTNKDDEAYNSCWDKLEFKTEEECRIACEKWIDERWTNDKRRSN